MKQEDKDRWVKALRGESLRADGKKYTQGHGCLRNDDNNDCCLGVLCDILNPDGWQGKSGNWWHLGAYYFPDSSLVDLGYDLQRFLSNMNDGSHIVGTFYYPDSSLVESHVVGGSCCNDYNGFVREQGKKYTFEEIADFIEKYVQVD